VNALERASRDLVSHPVRDPSPITVIERRASHLRRRRGSAIAALTTTVVLILAAGSVALTRETRSTHVSTSSPGVSTSSLPVAPAQSSLTLSAGNMFTPPTQAAGDQTLLRITLANGDTLTLQYPNELGIAGLGFQPATGIAWGPAGQPADCCSRTLEIRRGTVAKVFPGRDPQKAYPGSNGKDVYYFTGKNINYLAFQIDDWVVAVPDYEATTAATNNTPMTDDQRATYALSLTGRQTADGYLVLTPKPPLTLTYTDSPSANFGDGDLAVLYRACTTPTQPLPESHGFSLEARDQTPGTWLCYSRIPIVVHVTGSQDFQSRVTRELQVVANHQSAYG
jgi:hypothetical protein